MNTILSAFTAFGKWTTLAFVVSLLIGSAQSATTVSQNDGPHVFWQDDTTAIVLYLCNDSVITKTLQTKDTIQFSGLCTDNDQMYTIPVAPPIADSQTVFSNVSRVFALSDIHGSYEPMFNLLQATGVIDSAGHWSWGDGQLVVLGDIFDRGPNVTECLWLVYRLEREAAADGGAVHLLLGNHEMMALRGDLRYVNERYIKGINKITRITYDDMYGPDTELGRWVRTKPTAIVIDGTLFVHAGISLSLVSRRFSLAELNAQMRASLDLTSSQVAFDSTAKLFVGNLGPLWYRGYLHGIEGKYDPASMAQIDSVLDYYSARRVVVGHSEVEGGITVWHDGRVIAVDVDLETLGSFEGLLIHDTCLYRCTGAGARIQLDITK